MPRRPTLAAAAAAAVAALVLAGCGGGGGSSEPVAQGTTSKTAKHSTSSPSPSPRSTPTTSAPEVVDGVRLTRPGSRLKLGETARVSWNPNQHTTGVIAATVTGLLKMPISAFSAFRLNGATRQSTPYFVHATVRNLGKSDLSNVPVPLYLLDQRNVLLQPSTFEAEFPPCPSRPLPAKFRPRDKTSVCLVYFVPHHGRLVAVSFRPTEDFDAITWQGDVVDGGHPHRHQKQH